MILALEKPVSKLSVFTLQPQTVGILAVTIPNPLPSEQKPSLPLPNPFGLKILLLTILALSAEPQNNEAPLPLRGGGLFYIPTGA